MVIIEQDTLITMVNDYNRFLSYRDTAINYILYARCIYYFHTVILLYFIFIIIIIIMCWIDGIFSRVEKFLFIHQIFILVWNSCNRFKRYAMYRNSIWMQNKRDKLTKNNK